MSYNLNVIDVKSSWMKNFQKCLVRRSVLFFKIFNKNFLKYKTKGILNAQNDVESNGKEKSYSKGIILKDMLKRG